MKRKKYTFVDHGLILIAFALGIAFVFAILAGNNNPNEHILFAFFGLAYPFILAGNILLCIIWVLRKRYILSIITIILVCSSWQTLNATIGFFGNEGTAQKQDENDVRILTYNVHNFTPYGDKITEEVKEQMFQVIKDQNPDVVCIQEFFTRFKGKYNTVDSLKKQLKMDYFHFMPTMKSESEAIGLAIFTKYPIQNKGEIIFEENGGNGTVYVDLLINDKPLRVYNVHLQSISFDKEDYSYLEQVTKQMEVQNKSTKRIYRMLSAAFKKRSNQVAIMKESMKSCASPFIIAGDFNDTPASFAVTQITDSLHNAFEKQGAGFGVTYNGKFPNFQIDYIATTKDLEIVNYRVIKAKLSDHYPVRSDVRLSSNSE
jgi:endonuclease/exonuclease/phosphatase family metal-dependent hydrolase